MRLNVIAELLEERRREHGGLDRLGSRDRGMIRAEVHLAQGAERATELSACSGRAEPIGAQLDQIGSARDIAACGRDAAARVLDHGARHQIHADRDGRLVFGKLAVAVVEHDDGIGRQGLDDVADLLDLFNSQRGASGVALTALNIDHLGLLFGYRLFDALQVNGAVGEQGNLAVLNAEIDQRARAFGDADHGLDGVVGRAGHAEHLVARAQYAEQGDGQCMGAAQKMLTRQGVLSIKNIGIDLVERISAAVVIAVARRAGKHRLADMIFLKRLEHLLLLILLDPLDLLKMLAAQRHRLVGSGADFVVKFK